MLRGGVEVSKARGSAGEWQRGAERPLRAKKPRREASDPPTWRRLSRPQFDQFLYFLLHGTRHDAVGPETQNHEFCECGSTQTLVHKLFRTIQSDADIWPSRASPVPSVRICLPPSYSLESCTLARATIWGWVAYRVEEGRRCEGKDKNAKFRPPPRSPGLF